MQGTTAWDNETASTEAEKYRKLWHSVLEVEIAVALSHDKHSSALGRQAKAYLTTPSHDLYQVMEMAGYDPKKAFPRLRHFIMSSLTFQDVLPGWNRHRRGRRKNENTRS